MSIAPLISFKAGVCEVNEETKQVKPQPTPGYLYLYSDDDLLHFCWRPRSASLDNADLDLIMFPPDGSFTPYQKKSTNGRIFVLKFSSSSQRYLFWLQSRSQHSNEDPSYFSARDLKIGELVNSLLQGEDVNVNQEMANIPSRNSPDDEGDDEGDDEEDEDDDDDETMEDVEGTNHDSRRDRSGSGGAGPDATGGDVREEGEEAREGGADGGRASTHATDAQSIIQNFISAMAGSSRGPAAPQQKLFTTLQDLLTPTSTVAWIDAASEGVVDQVLQFLPPNLPKLVQEGNSGGGSTSSPLSVERKKDLIKKVLRSPQFTQSLASLTVALRDGGLPSISEALSIPVQNGGYMRRGGVPLGGGEAVEIFLNGVKEAVDKEGGDESSDVMETE